MRMLLLEFVWVLAAVVGVFAASIILYWHRASILFVA